MLFIVSWSFKHSYIFMSLKNEPLKGNQLPQILERAQSRGKHGYMSIASIWMIIISLLVFYGSLYPYIDCFFLPTDSPNYNWSDVYKYITIKLSSVDGTILCSWKIMYVLKP